MPVNWLWSKLEAPVTDVASLRARNLWLACIHVVLFATSGVTLVVIVLQLKLLVTLTQRSNVETLTLAIVAAILVFMMLSTIEATAGGVLLLYARAIPRDRAQRWLQRRFEKTRRSQAHSYIDAVVEGPGGKPVEIRIADEYGALGTVRLDRTDVAFDLADGVATALTQLVVHSLGELGKADGLTDKPHVVFWNGMEEHGSRAYFAQVSAFQRLEGVLGGTPLWPRVVLGETDIARMRSLLRDAASAVREDLLMPDIEYGADFLMPIVPQPLGFVQLKRQAQRADPVAAMGCSALMALFFLAVVLYAVIAPPWVPSK